METPQTFGKKQEFSIRHRRISNLESSNDEKMAFCHLVVGGMLLGDVNEECYLPTWISKIIGIRRRIENTKDQLFPIEFHEMNDREIFESILKSNQLTEEFNIDFSYLPQLDLGIWNRHNFSIDETIDKYQICFYVKEECLTFLINKRVGYSNTDSKNDLFVSVNLQVDRFLKTVDEATDFLRISYNLFEDEFEEKK